MPWANLIEAILSRGFRFPGVVKLTTKISYPRPHVESLNWLWEHNIIGNMDWDGGPWWRSWRRDWRSWGGLHPHEGSNRLHPPHTHPRSSRGLNYQPKNIHGVTHGASYICGRGEAPRVGKARVDGWVGERPHRGKGRGDGIVGFWRGDLERGKHLKCK
jgi:hypothetical protein